MARGIHDKLVSRHPHVFGPGPSGDLSGQLVEVDGADAVMRNWEQLKRVEKGHDSVMDGISGSLPSLLYAHKVQRKAESVGVEVAPMEPPPADIGEALFALVAAAKRAGVDPESALRSAATRFRDEVRVHETSLRGAQVNISNTSNVNNTGRGPS